jgi:hypothetical protein
VSSKVSTLRGSNPESERSSFTRLCTNRLPPASKTVASAISAKTSAANERRPRGPREEPHALSRRELLLARDRARQPQARDVDAADEQQRADGRAQQREASCHAARGLLERRHEPNAEAAVRVGILRGKVRGDDVEIGLGFRERHAGPQPAEHVDETRVAVLRERGIEPRER